MEDNDIDDSISPIEFERLLMKALNRLAEERERDHLPPLTLAEIEYALGVARQSGDGTSAGDSQWGSAPI